MICTNCKEDHENLKSAAFDGKFGHYCSVCLDDNYRLASPGSAAYSRARDKEDFRKDILQPRINGKINKEFVDAYPEESGEMFTEDELKEI